MNLTVPTLSIVFIALDMLLGVLIPIALFLILRKRFGCDRAPFFAGCAVMLLFAFVLEQIAHSVILGSAFGARLQQNVLLYSLYGGFMAGLFEETGRYVAFRTVLRKKQLNDRNALMYGAGHGGFEMFVLLTFGMINNLLYCVMLNTGNAALLTTGLSGDSLAVLEAAFVELSTAKPAMFLVSLVERGAALTAQIALSVLVWFAAKKRGKTTLLYPLAVVLHLVLDTGAVLLYQQTQSILLVETAVWVFAIGCVALAVWTWRRNASPAVKPDNAERTDAEAYKNDADGAANEK